MGIMRVISRAICLGIEGSAYQLQMPAVLKVLLKGMDASCQWMSIRNPDFFPNLDFMGLKSRSSPNDCVHFAMRWFFFIRRLFSSEIPFHPVGFCLLNKTRISFHSFFTIHVPVKSFLLFLPYERAELFGRTAWSLLFHLKRQKSILFSI